MKKIIGILSLLVLLIITACSNEKPAVVKKEIIVKEAPEKNTSVIVDKNGVKVETKKVEVIINPEKKKQ